MTAARRFESSGALRGAFTPPADKSLLHRALLLASMSGGLSRITAHSCGADVGSTRRCLQALGTRIEASGRDLTVTGTRWDLPPAAELDTGNSGTTMRLLTGAVAGRPGTYRLRGDASLSKRPMLRVAEPLRRMGAQVGLAEGDTPPIAVTGTALRSIEYQPSVASAQVKGCILLAGLQAEGTTTVVEPIPTRDHTERLLGWLGCRVASEQTRVSVTGGEELFSSNGFSLAVPGDVSSAAFLIVAACLIPGSEISVTGVGLNPGRIGAIEVLKDMGANIHTTITHMDPEPVGTIQVSAGALQATAISGAMIPKCVDELPILALAATQAEGETLITDAADLRFKEANRIEVLARGLNALGAQVEELGDGLRVTGPTPLIGGTVNSRGDHRMALTFAVAGLLGGGPVDVRGWAAVGISYPEFEADLAELNA
ncbi:MAG: 3-phosphoshikimate 1-carboxyvinyltransferase [Actinomycetota bacterium]